jgi:hypothetical protein
MVLSIIFLEDKHKILLHLSIFYEYRQFFQHRICFSIQRPITNETSHVTTHATHSDPWPTLARSISFFLIMLFNKFLISKFKGNILLPSYFTLENGILHNWIVLTMSRLFNVNQPAPMIYITGAWGMDFVSSSPIFSTTPPFFKIFI